jgi:hypothetical protein
VQGWVQRSDGGIGGPLRSVLRLARAGWARFGRERQRAEREKESREREREQRRGVWLGVTGWGWLETVRKRADSEREREQRLRMRGVKMVENSRETHALFWKMVYGKIFRKPFSVFYLLIFRSKQNIFC